MNLNTLLMEEVSDANFYHLTPTDSEGSLVSRIEQLQAIGFRLTQLPNITPEVENRLSRLGYVQVILNPDHFQRYLIPSKFWQQKQ